MCTGAQDIYSCGCQRVTFDEPCDYFRCTDWKSFKPRNLTRGCYACNSRRNPIKSDAPAATEIITSKPDTDDDTSAQVHESLPTQRMGLKMPEVMGKDTEAGKQEFVTAIRPQLEKCFAKLHEDLTILRVFERGDAEWCMRDISDGYSNVQMAEEYLGKRYKRGEVIIQEIKDETMDAILDVLLKM